MTDFEIQRRLRAMNAPRPPGRDLWPAIAARIESAQQTTTTRAPRRRWIPLAAAAGFVLVVAGSLATLTLREHAPASSDVDYAMTTRVERISPQQALEQHPDAVFLVSLLNRTNAQRMKIEQLGANAG